MKDIMLRITGKQISRNNDIEDSEIEFITQAVAYRKPDAIYIVYNESEVSGMEGIKANLRIGDDGEIRLKRFSDEMSANTMNFSEGNRFEGFYETPVGVIPMEVLTNSIEKHLDEELFTGSLDIDYDVSLKGLAETHTHLRIEISGIAEKSENELGDVTPIYTSVESRPTVN